MVGIYGNNINKVFFEDMASSLLNGWGRENKKHQAIQEPKYFSGGRTVQVFVLLCR